MVSKIKTLPQQDTGKEDRTTLADSPLLDLSDTAVKNRQESSYVTDDQINSVLPSEEVNSEQIEDDLAMLSEMGVNVVATEQANEEGEEQREEPAVSFGATSRRKAGSAASSPKAIRLCVLPPPIACVR
jgi:Sigma-70 factor, region 1.1